MSPRNDAERKGKTIEKKFIQTGRIGKTQSDYEPNRISH
jgi:hypothetical protein